jgi:hypothetical protein
MSGMGTPQRGGQNCNPFGRTSFAGNDAPQAVDAKNGTFGKLAACQIFAAAGPGLAHLILSEAQPNFVGGAKVSGWGTTFNGTELPICRATPWYNSTTAEFRVEEDGAISISATLHVASDTASTYRRLSLVWSPANGSTPVAIAVCEKPPASDTAVPVPLQIQVTPNFGAGDRFWLTLEYDPSDVQVTVLGFPYSWISLAPA